MPGARSVACPLPGDWCLSTRCNFGQVRHGVCNGTTNAFKCVECANTTCTRDTEYRKGTCGGTNDGFTCHAQPVCNYPAQYFQGGGSVNEPPLLFW